MGRAASETKPYTTCDSLSQPPVYPPPHALPSSLNGWTPTVRYEPHKEFIQLDASKLGGIQRPNERFKFTTAPATFPTLSTDIRLLRNIYHNAISNAIKYGKKEGVISSDVSFQSGRLKLRVANEPGAG